MQQPESFEELVVSVITKDEDLQKKLAEKVGEALGKLDLEPILVDGVSSAISDVFERDEVYEILDKAIQAELKRAIASYFKK